MLERESEIWLPVNGYEKYYKISSWGNLLALPRFRGGRGGSVRWCFEKIKKSSLVGSGYLSTSMYNESGDGKGVRKYIHRLVAEHFVPNPLSLAEVNHNDGVKTNNYYQNLSWSSHADNLNHAHKSGLKGRLPHDVIIEIFVADQSATSLSKKHGLSISMISLIKNRKAWTFLTENL